MQDAIPRLLLHAPDSTITRTAREFMTINTSPFTLKPVADKELTKVAISILEWLNKQSNRYDLAIHFPLSQAIDPKSHEASKSLMGLQYTGTIPLAILTPFPNGKLLATVFDIKSEDPLITEILLKTGVKVITKDAFSNLTPRDIMDALNGERKSKLYERNSVGFQQFQAYKIIADRAGPLEQYNPFVLLHEVRASSIATIKREAIHSNSSSWGYIWDHAQKTSFDCLVVEKNSMYPLLAVEFDGGHHQDDKQKRKDELKNEYCNKLSLPLIRINECYLNNDLTPAFLEYQKSYFLQGLIFEVLGHAYLKRIDQLKSRKKISDFTDKQRDINPDITSESIVFKYFADEEVRIDEQVSQQAEEWEKERLCNEYKSIYNADPEIQFSTDRFERIFASLAVPVVVSRKTLIFNCPTAIKAEIFGIDNRDLESLIKNYMSRFLLELAISAGN
ncbi:hypothetical protein SFMTTN_1693 [Sulfuriferula multivorans]|uniref:DUF2726 domain-containing protein n=1 Tax=Sulfuriferula multivorans TaxID=1559896 RepID=A0A401JE54_9PROT|nr:DUF2726 domain-containing protein [Sulfuriferula multivorans]GBL45882.1 hypothetical protein SFMTTN_1693 [Sulfuriferula multivorans]